MRFRLLVPVVFTSLVLSPVALCRGQEKPGASTAPTSSAEAAEAAMIEPQRSSFNHDLPANVKVLKTATGHLLVPALVNGQDAGWFILDTGAGMSCIDKQVADDLKLSEGGGVTARGVGGERESKLRKFDSLSVGPVRVEEGVLLELNLKPYGLLMGKPIAGIIGHECFQAGVFDIDFSADTVNVFDPKTYQQDAAAKWSAMEIVKRRPAVEGSIEGSAPGLFLVDTGSNEGVLVHAPAVTRLNLLEGRKTSTSVAGGVGGMKKVRHGKLAAAAIGGCEVSDVPATFSEAKDGIASDDEVLATVGLKLLQNFRMIVNQSAGQIAFQRVGQAKAASTAPATQPHK